MCECRIKRQENEKVHLSFSFGNWNELTQRQVSIKRSMDIVRYLIRILSCHVPTFIWGIKKSNSLSWTCRVYVPFTLKSTLFSFTFDTFSQWQWQQKKNQFILSTLLSIKWVCCVGCLRYFSFFPSISYSYPLYWVAVMKW